MIKSNFLKVALAQIAPVWLQKEQTIQKIENAIINAAKEKAELIVFGEALLPGYPFWIGLTNGAAWNSSVLFVLPPVFWRLQTIDKPSMFGMTSGFNEMLVSVQSDFIFRNVNCSEITSNIHMLPKCINTLVGTDDCSRLPHHIRR